MSHLNNEEAHTARPAVKWRAGEIPQSPGEALPPSVKGNANPQWRSNSTTKQRKRK